VILALLIGCALRRIELAELNVETIQQRKGRWVLADLEGKGRCVARQNLFRELLRLLHPLHITVRVRCEMKIQPKVKTLGIVRNQRYPLQRL
jgi:hypothetical protein